MTERSENNFIRFLWIGAVVLIVTLWGQNDTLQKKVKACDWEIGVANDSIAYADQEIQDAHDKAWSDYQTMGYGLQKLEGGYVQRPNPCNKDFSGNLSDYSKL